jgi:peptidoglycan/LPS O-acetylase OafA/YrhL
VRLSFLDSVRGIAALIVLTAHLHLAAEAQTWVFDLWILRIFKASVFAVAMFFVLSGLVLYLQVEGRGVNYASFIVRRAFRIFPACIVAVTISFLIYLAWSPAPTAIPFLNETTWPPGISFDEYLDHLWLGTDTSLLRPIWSLVIEWRVSLIFPAIIILFSWSPIMAGSAAFAIACSIVYSPATQAGYASVQMIAFYGSLFVTGIFIAAYRFRIVLFLRSRIWLRLVMLMFCGYYLWFRSESATPNGYFFQGFISGVLIAVSMSTSRVRAFLRIPSLQYLGRISYSLYLVHMIWIGILFRVLDGINPLVVCATVIIASIGSADLMNRFIEKPSNKFGRYIASFLRTPPLLKGYLPTAIGFRSAR